MITRLEKAFDAVRKLPPERQEEIAAVIETAVDEPSYVFTPDEMKKIEEGIADADAGRFATDEEVEEVFAQFGRV